LENNGGLKLVGMPWAKRYMDLFPINDYGKMGRIDRGRHTVGKIVMLIPRDGT
jgi:hypothetical protein